MSNYITKPKPGVMVNPLHPLSRGLVGYWLFNEGAGSLVNDISGHKNHGRLKNMLPNVQGSGWGASKYGGTLNFDGVNDGVDCGNDASLDITAMNAFTIEAWIYLNGESSLGLIAGKRGYDIGLRQWYSINNISFALYNTDNTSFKVGKSDIPLLEWHHFVGVYDNKDLELLYDGISSGTVTLTGTLKDLSAVNILIGYGSNSFSGSVNSVRIYNRALSASEVKMLYEQPFCNLMK